MDKLIIKFGRDLDVIHNQYEQYRKADPHSRYYEGACDAMINTKVLVIKLLEEMENENTGVSLQEPDRIL